MSEISLQALQFTPRFLSVLLLLALTWLVAKFAQYIFKQVSGGGFSQLISRMAFWSVFVIMAPFALHAAGIKANFLYGIQHLEAQVFSYTPLWMVMSLLLAGVVFLFRGVPKFVAQTKDTFGTSTNEMKN